MDVLLLAPSGPAEESVQEQSVPVSGQETGKADPLIRDLKDLMLSEMGELIEHAIRPRSGKQLGKMLHMKLGNPTQIADSLRAEALFDKLLKKHVMTCAFSNSKVEVNCLIERFKHFSIGFKTS